MRDNSKSMMYHQLLEKIDQVCEIKKKTREKNLMTSTPSPPIPDLWIALHPHSSTSLPLSFQCPHCPHCKSPLHPHFPRIPKKTLLTSLKSCHIELQFINAIVWMKSMVTASPVVPISHIKNILKALIEIEENSPPELLIQSHSSCKDPSLIIDESREFTSLPPILSMIQNHHRESQEFPASLGQSENLKKTKSRGKKRKLEQDDSAVSLWESPGRTWDSYTSDLHHNYNKRDKWIPETDDEASQMTPDMSFGGSYDGNCSYPLVQDSGLYEESLLMSPKGHDDDDDVDEHDKTEEYGYETRNNVQEIGEKLEENDEEIEIVSSIKLSSILREFPIISAALSIVRSTLRALEAEDTVLYCWREGELVENAVKMILRFIDTVAVEEYKYPGYLDFFVKCSMETVRNTFERFTDINYVNVQRYHHLQTILELCNCRPICEGIITYLFELLSKLVNEESIQENSSLIVSTQSKYHLILDTLYATIEKYVNIMGSNMVQSSLDFFHLRMENPTEKLLNSWSIHSDNFVTNNFHVSPAKVSFVKSIVRNLKIQLTKQNEY